MQVTRLVKTVISGILFACFLIVKPITKKQLSIYDIIVFQKKFQPRRKVQFLQVGLLFSLHSFSKLTFTMWKLELLETANVVNILLYRLQYYSIYVTERSRSLQHIQTESHILLLTRKPSLVILCNYRYSICVSTQ